MENFDANKSNLPTEEELEGKMKKLIAQAEMVNADIDQTNGEANAAVDELSREVGEVEKAVDEMNVELGKDEKTAEDELDRLMMQRAEEIAAEDAEPDEDEAE